MAKSKKKTKADQVLECHVDEPHTLGTLAKAFTEYTQECAESDMEAFEAYSHRLQFHMHHHIRDFADRLDRGYQSILEHLNPRS